MKFKTCCVQDNPAEYGTAARGWIVVTVADNQPVSRCIGYKKDADLLCLCLNTLCGGDIGTVQYAARVAEIHERVARELD